MGFWTYLIAASIALALLQRLLVVLLVILALAVLSGVCFRPAETFGLLFMGFMLNLIKAHPWAGVLMLSLIALIYLLQRRDRPDD